MKIPKWIKSKKFIFTSIGIIFIIAIVVLFAFKFYDIIMFLFGGMILGGTGMKALEKTKSDIIEESFENEQKIKNNSYDDTSKQLDELIRERKEKSRTSRKS